MHELRHHKIPGFGLRSVKTALATTICALAYAIIGRNPTFACIGAVFGLGSNLEDSWLNGGNRLIGTIIGGFLGIGLFWARLNIFANVGDFIIMPLLFIGTIMLVSLSVIFHWPGAVQPGGVVLCIVLFNTPVATYVSYALNRMLDTGIGVIVALCINMLLTRERTDRWRLFFKRNFPFKRKSNTSVNLNDIKTEQKDA